MLASDRTVYGRRFAVTPVWLWMLQRASGLLLGPLVALHVWMPGMAANRALDALLLAIVVAHGYSGLRRIAVKHQPISGMAAVTWAWCVVVALCGGLVLIYR